jgi:hypothetical protein
MATAYCCSTAALNENYRHVRLWHLADAPVTAINVCFLGKSRYHNERASRPLMTQSGHRRQAKNRHHWGDTSANDFVTTL